MTGGGRRGSQGQRFTGTALNKLKHLLTRNSTVRTWEFGRPTGRPFMTGVREAPLQSSASRAITSLHSQRKYAQA
jgi:hypothetical protein